MEIIAALCGLMLGLLAGYFFARASVQKNSSAVEEMAELKSRMLQESFDKRTSDLEEAHKRETEALEAAHKREVEALKENNQKLLSAMEEKQRQSLEALKEQFSQASNAMSEQLKSTTQSMLKESQKEFSESSREKIGQILEPIKDSLKTMQEKVNENTIHHAKLGGELNQSIKTLLSHTESAQASADRLASMLKGSNKHQGEWGERILKEILESLNLKEGIHFDIQQTLTDDSGSTLKNEEGRRARPDVVLHLDQTKDVIIDSKVSLTAYLEYMEAETDEARDEALKKHIDSIEKHVKELERKDYSGYTAKSRVRLGYVIMFVPNTSALLLATNAKPTLWREAMEKNVYIADEQTLYAALKIVGLTWNQILQNASQQEVFKLAEEMIQRVGAFVKSFTDIGKQLNSALESYDSGLKKLTEGGQSIPQTCRKLVKLGARVSKLPKGVDPSLFSDEPVDALPEE